MRDCIQPVLVGYVASLKEFRGRSASQPGQRKSLDGWGKATMFAEEALEKSQDAEALRKVNSIVDANATTKTAFKNLKLRYDSRQRILFSLQVNPSTVQMWYRLLRNSSTRL